MKYSYSYEFDAFTNEYAGDYILSEQNNIDVTNYFLSIIINLEEEAIEGRERIYFHTDSTLNRAVFNLYGNMEVHNLELNGRAIEFSRDDRHLFINNRFAKDSLYELTLDYSGRPEYKGLCSFNFDEVKDSKVIYTINEPYYASTWFLCNDKPDDKAKFNISVTNDSLYTSVSIGNLDSIITQGANKKYFWSTDYEIPTYLASFYSGVFNEYKNIIDLQGKRIPVIIYGYNLDERTVNQVSNTIENSVKTFNDVFSAFPFPDDKIGIVEIPWTFGGIENYSAIGIGEQYFSPMGLFDDFFVHEVAHYWWGASVTPAQLSEIWLNESFASYSEVLFDEFNYGKESATGALISKPFENYDESLNSPGRKALTSLTYNNGAWVLHLLRNEIGDSSFFEVLRGCQREFGNGNSTAERFRKVCEKIYGRDLSYFFNRFVYHESDFPNITIKLSGNNLWIEQSGADNVRLKMYLNLWKYNKLPVKYNPVIYKSLHRFDLSQYGKIDSVSCDEFKRLPYVPKIIIEKHFN